MMDVQDTDARRAAEHFVDRYGCAAPDEARRRARELDLIGWGPEAAKWERIARLAQALLTEPDDTIERLH